MSVQAPTLLSPNGGELFVLPTLTISWTTQGALDTGGLPCWFEILFTDNYRTDSEPNWTQIASIPSSASSFIWDVPSSINSNTCRIGIRVRNSVGTRSTTTYSANTFTIRRASLPIPQIVSPVAGQRYNSSVTLFVVDAAALDARGYYHLSYSSQSAGIQRTTIAQMVPSTSMPFFWETVRLPAADDYLFYAMTVDRDGNTSEAATVPIRIRHEGFVIVDTAPPQATVQIQGGSPYTNQNAISVSVFAYDAATDVQSIQINEIKTDGTYASSGPAQLPSDAAAYTLSTGDGFKNIGLLAQDFAGNRNYGGNNRVFLNILSNANTQVVDFDYIVTSTETLVYAVTIGSQNSLYQITTFAHFIAAINATPVCVKAYADEVYVSVVDSGNVGHVWKYTSDGFISVYDFVNVDEYVTCMGVFNTLMYWGTNTGRLISFDGVNADDVENLSSQTLGQITNNVPVKMLGYDNCGLYITLQNTTHVYVYDGTNIYGVA